MQVLRAALVALVLIVASIPAHAQTTAGSATTIVIPVTAQTASFISEVTVQNPNGVAVTVNATFYEANNSSQPGTYACTNAVIPANRSVQFSLASQCGRAAPPSHFGLLVLAEQSASNPIYGYVRTQTPQGQGFSTEGFPVGNFNDQVSHATGLKKQAAAPGFQTNCFAGALAQPVTYSLKLFNDTTGAQIGSTINGNLDAFQQVRYLDIFGPAGVNAPAGDQFNVRAEFTPTSTAALIGFCTVQDNTSFGADFRIAKSYGTPLQYVQGGNSFGTTAILGTKDNQALDIRVNDQRVMRYEPLPASPNVIGGSPNNVANAPNYGQTIGGGGSPNANCFDALTATFTRRCGNETAGLYATIGGGNFNLATGFTSTIGGGGGNTVINGDYSVVAGGVSNIVDGSYSTIGGGFFNQTYGNSSTVAGGYGNGAGDYAFAVGRSSAANGSYSVAMGRRAISEANGSFVFADSNDFDFTVTTDNAFRARVTGGARFVVGIDVNGINTWACTLTAGNNWSCSSDRALKQGLVALDGRAVLESLMSMPVYQWQPKGVNAHVKHYGPTAQDFYAAFGLGDDDKMIGFQDAEGVALAAIQGLNAKLEAQVAEQRLELSRQRNEIAELRRAVEELLAQRDQTQRIAKR